MGWLIQTWIFSAEIEIWDSLLEVRRELERRFQCVKESQTPVFWFFPFSLPFSTSLLAFIFLLVFSRPWFFLRRSLFSSVFGCFLQTFSFFSLILKLVYVFDCFLSTLSHQNTEPPHPPFLSYVFSWSFPCVLVFLPLISPCNSFSFFSCTCLAGRDLQPAPLPFPHRAFPPVELMGNAVFPPSLLPPPPSSPASLSSIAQWKTLNEKDFGWGRRRVNSSYFPVCIFYCLPVAASRHSAFEAGYASESVERFILERVVVDWHLTSLLECDCYPYAEDHMWLTAPALCASLGFLPNLQLGTFWWLSSPWKEVEIVFPFTLKA